MDPGQSVREVIFALAALVLGAGAVLVLVWVGLRTRASVAALGVVLIAVGGAIAYETGIRPARRRGEPVRAALGSGLRQLRRASRWLVGGTGRGRP